MFLGILLFCPTRSAAKPLSTLDGSWNDGDQSPLSNSSLELPRPAIGSSHSSAELHDQLSYRYRHGIGTGHVWASSSSGGYELDMVARTARNGSN
jgi:hypothetical protein